MPTEPLKSLKKKGKTLKTNKEFLARIKKKKQGISHKKARKGRTGQRKEGQGTVTFLGSENHSWGYLSRSSLAPANRKAPAL